MMLRLTAIVCLGALGFSGLILASNLDCSKPEHEAVLPRAAASVAPMRYRGLAVQAQNGFRPIEYYGPIFHDIAGLGANTVLLCAAGFMEHAESQQIFLEARKMPSREEFKTIIRMAKKENLQVILMPIILLSKPRGSEWRGVIKPPDWDEWWDEYREFIKYFCEIAREGGADGLMVGSELVSTEKFTEKWNGIIDLAREQFYGGKLGYSANWDHYKPIKFWHKLDFVGMTSYYTLADKKDPSVEDIVARWEPIRDEVLGWQREVGKPLIFTEVGWCSQEGAATAPWNYFQNQKATVAGHEEQRRLYEAFLKVWDDAPGVAGVIWWDWSGEPGGSDDFGYTPKGKPAEQVLRDWFAKYNNVATDGEAQVAEKRAAGTPKAATP
jgi:hypothetical protein